MVSDVFNYEKKNSPVFVLHIEAFRCLKLISSSVPLRKLKHKWDSLEYSKWWSLLSNFRNFEHRLSVYRVYSYSVNIIHL